MEQEAENTAKPDSGGQGDEQAVVSFCHKLDAFAAALSEEERLVLGGLLFRAMGPLDRFRWANSSDVLTAEEKQVLRRLSDVGEG